MPKSTRKESGWLAQRVENALQKAYATIRVEPDEYLTHLRAAHGLPVQSYEGMFTVPVDPALKYCFRVRGTDGNRVYQSRTVAIRGANCDT